MKDMPTVLPDGLEIPCLLEREDPRDVFISSKAAALWDLPDGAVVGTASLRRQAQILHRRPDLKVVNIRGNVQTRLRKIEAGEADATLLALAGLKRLGLTHEATAVIPLEDMLPAVAQGAIGIECRTGDDRILELLTALNHPATQICVSAERAMLAVLDGSCRTPIAGLAQLGLQLGDGGDLSFRAMVLTPDGRTVHETSRVGPASDAERMGRDAGEELRQRAGPNFFADLAESAASANSAVSD
jgi:hydroxymethylbilane synthase